MTGTDVLNVIIQAGGHGRRMGQLTANKPKALIPLRGKPLIFHTLDLFPHSDIVVIGDYKIDVLRRYCEAFGRHEHLRIVRADGSGTCAGISEAAKHLDQNAPVILTWCDLIFSDSPAPLFADLERAAVGLSTSFPCRWSFRDGRLVHAASSTEGVAGCFWFPCTSFLDLTPSSGEFCEYLASCSALDALGVPLGDLCTEVGTLDAYERQTAKGFSSRPFNRITALPDGTLLKEPVDAQGESLAKLEQAWYQQASRASLDCVPAILCYEPLRMEMIQGTEPYRLSSSSSNLEMIIRGLCQLHEAFPTVPADSASLDQAYLGKTTERLEKVARLIPMADCPEIVINGEAHRNPLHHWDELGDAIRRQYPPAFSFIHGDPTFSNMLISDGRVVFIDPRGYFGTTQLFGDPAYDWAKLLYSLLTNYDQFNLGRFRLSIESGAVELDIRSSGWEHLATDIFAASGLPEPYLMRVLGIIWLSLTTYAWDDYDKVCGSFYKGTEVLSALWD